MTRSGLPSPLRSPIARRGLPGRERRAVRFLECPFAVAKINRQGVAAVIGNDDIHKTVLIHIGDRNTDRGGSNWQMHRRSK